MNSNKTPTVLIVLVLVVSLAFGFAGGLAASYLLPARGEQVNDNNHENNQPGQDVNIEVSEDITIAEAIALKVMPSVVGISTVSTQTMSGFGGFDTFDFFGFGGGGGYSYDSTSVGTGVIVDQAGYILTNSHVVNDGDTKSIMISLYDGSDVEGTVLWNDATLDLAVVKIEMTGLKAAELGNSDEINIGAYAAAIGNPLGLQFERSISQGIISGLDRTIVVGTSSNSTSGTTMEGLIQTDATINGGNSGGPLLNSKGQVIGINSAKASSGEGMGFAIPINVAAPIVKQIKETGKFQRAYLGITGTGLEDQTQYTSKQLIDHFGTDKGIYINSVSEGGGAKRAGLKTGDIILTVDGEPVNTMNRINAIMIRHIIGDEVEVTYMRDGKERNVIVTLNGEQILLRQGITD